MLPGWVCMSCSCTKAGAASSTVQPSRLVVATYAYLLAAYWVSAVESPDCPHVSTADVLVRLGLP